MRLIRRGMCKCALVGMLAAAAMAAPARAVNLPPGGAVSISGSNASPRTVIRDAVIPFEIRDGFGTLLFQGSVQDRVARRDSDGALVFEKRLVNTTAALNGIVVSFTVNGYSGVSCDVDWAPGLGTQAPSRVNRTADGDVVGYFFESDNRVFAGTESEFCYNETDAEAFAISGVMTIALSTGPSTTVRVAAPVIDDTPPVAELTGPDPLSCVCNPTNVTGVADDPDGTFDHFVLESRPATGTTWTTIATSNVPVPAPGGVLASWDTTSAPEGYHLLRLTVFNTVGLSSTVVTVVWVSKDFDTATFGVPAVAGGTVCPGGTVFDANCTEQYTIEYAPSSGGSFAPIDPSSPTYTGQRVNQTLGTWDSTAVADGQYDLLLSATNDCGNTASQRHTIEIDNTPPVAEIRSPENCGRVGAGSVEITGVVSDANLSGWSLSYTGGDANGWVTIATGNSPVDGTLAVWDVSDLRPCCYTLRLTASDSAVVNCNGAINNRSTFLVSVAVGCPADYNGDGVQDVFDLLDFLSFWFMTCP